MKLIVNLKPKNKIVIEKNNDVSLLAPKSPIGDSELIVRENDNKGV